MQNTENFSLKVYDGEDLFNPLTVENVNMNAIDTQMKKNENHAVGDATELVSGTVHAITRLTPDAPMLRFTATSRFTSGDTFTVDGVQVSALTVSGEQLPDGAYIIGSEVLAYLKGTLLTVFTSQGTLATAKNALKLGGNNPEYYATASAVQTAQETATAAGNLANEINNSLIIKRLPISSNYFNFPVYKYGEIKMIQMPYYYDTKKSIRANENVLLASIPSEYAPYNGQFTTTTRITNAGEYATITIKKKENGVVDINFQPLSTLPSGAYILLNFIWI